MVFSAIKKLNYVLSSPSTDTFVFKLCYRWSTLLLVFFSFVATCKLGYSLECVAIRDAFTERYMNSKCYGSVYIQPATFFEKEGSQVTPDPSYKDFKRYQSYYPWVNLFFLIHAFNFYLPHLLWKYYEKGRMHRLTAEVQEFFDKEEKRGSELYRLAKYVCITKGKHKVYAATYIFFEACNFAISLAQTLWLVNFFDVNGVPDFLPYVIETWSEFQSFYFPSEASCELFRTGASGVRQLYRTTCLLSSNVMYMKMFLFLYAWYVLVTVLCGLVLVYRITLLVRSFRVLVSRISSPLSERSAVWSVCHALSYSDWFFLSALQNSMADVDFSHLVDKIVVVSEGKDKKDDNVRLPFHDDASKEFDTSDAISHF